MQSKIIFNWGYLNRPNSIGDQSMKRKAQPKYFCYLENKRKTFQFISIKYLNNCPISIRITFFLREKNLEKIFKCNRPWWYPTVSQWKKKLQEIVTKWTADNQIFNLIQNPQKLNIFELVLWCWRAYHYHLQKYTIKCLS